MEKRSTVLMVVLSAMVVISLLLAAVSFATPTPVLARGGGPQPNGVNICWDEPTGGMCGECGLDKRMYAHMCQWCDPVCGPAYVDYTFCDYC